MFNDLMDNIEWFFNLHDKNKDGYLTKDEVLTLSESFLVGLTNFRQTAIDTFILSSYSVLRLETLTWELLAASCLTLSNMETLCYPNPRNRTLTTLRYLQSSLTNHTSILRRMCLLPIIL